MGQKLSMGLTLKQVARLEGMALADVALVAEFSFKALIDGYNTLHAMPEDEQRRILTQLSARHLLMEAMPWAMCGWPCSSCSRSAWARNPARAGGRGAITAADKRAAGPPQPRRTPSPAHAQPLSDDPDLRAMHRVESRLRRELQQEHAAAQRRGGGGRGSSCSATSSRRGLAPDNADRCGLPRPGPQRITRAAPSRPCSG